MPNRQAKSGMPSSQPRRQTIPLRDWQLKLFGHDVKAEAIMSRKSGRLFLVIIVPAVRPRWSAKRNQMLEVSAKCAT